MVPCWKKYTSPRGSPKKPCAWKYASVSAWVAGLVMTRSGTGRPYRRDTANTFSA